MIKLALLKIAATIIALVMHLGSGVQLPANHPIVVRYTAAADDLVTAAGLEMAGERRVRVAFVWSYFEASWMTSPKGPNDQGTACGVGQVHVAEFVPLHVLDPSWTCAALRKDRVLGYRAMLRAMRYFEGKCGSLQAGMTAFSMRGACPPPGWTIQLVKDRCELAGGC